MREIRRESRVKFATAWQSVAILPLLRRSYVPRLRALLREYVVAVCPPFLTGARDTF